MVIALGRQAGIFAHTPSVLGPRNKSANKMRKIPRTFRIPSWYVPTGMVLIYARLSKLITHAPPEPSSPCFFLLAGAVASVLYVCEYVVRSNNNNKLDDTSRTHFDDDNSIKLATFAAIAHFMYARNDDNDGNVV